MAAAPADMSWNGTLETAERRMHSVHQRINACQTKVATLLGSFLVLLDRDQLRRGFGDLRRTIAFMPMETDAGRERNVCAVCQHCNRDRFHDGKIQGVD